VRCVLRVLVGVFGHARDYTTDPKTGTSSPMPKRAHFSPELFAFLRELKRNNDRNWFLDNKSRYEEHVKAAMLSFIADLKPAMAKISRAVDVDPRPVGGSMFRIHRDTRFSRDKSPYKTHASAYFPARTRRDVHPPGYYFHLEPGAVFVAGGAWHPDTKSATRIRAAMLDRPKDWIAATRAKTFTARCELGEGDLLRRPPKGVAPDHPLVEDLKRRSFIATAHFSEVEACRAGFLDEVIDAYRRIAPLNRFLCRAMRVAF